MSENKNVTSLDEEMDDYELTCLRWREALEEYASKHHGSSNYRDFLLELILKDKISIEQADWILERIGELPVEDSCGCGCGSSDSCGCGGQCHCDSKSCSCGDNCGCHDKSNK